MVRESIPKILREKVLDEYDHRCAVCGGDRPHLHHIDEDATNNVVENLLPLCPNCHLRDQHNPTRKIEISKLKLFREYKDPCILKPQFHPIFERQAFLDGVELNSNSIDELDNQANELIEFVASLEMGQFYSKRLKELLGKEGFALMYSLDGGNDEKVIRQINKERENYRNKLSVNNKKAKKLLVELLRYQAWAD